MPVIRPKKTYQANPFPTTAASGQQGAYGAMLPTAPVAGLQRGGSPALGANTSAGSVTTTRGTFGQIVNNPVPLSQPVLPPKKEAGSSNVQRQMSPMDSILSALTMGKVDNFNEVLRLNNTPSTARGTYGQTAGATTTPASTSVFIPKASTFDYQANVLERNSAALSMMQPTPENPNGQWPKQLSSQDAQALGIGQALIDAGYQMYGGNLVAPPALTAPTVKSNFGTYAESDKAYSGQAKTAQEAFQQGSYKPGKRWWIGRGKTHGENDYVAPAAPTEPEIVQTTSGFTGQLGLVNFNTGT